MHKDEKVELSDELLRELKYFEDFLKKVGFKRIDGSIYGYLSLSSNGLSSEEIQKSLGLSQSAVSNSLKVLCFYKAVTMEEDRTRGCRVYEASEDCLSIVANVFRKRESEFINEYKGMAERVIKHSFQNGDDEESVRVKRFRSIVSSCELGESVIKLVFSLDSLGLNHHLPKITEKLPQLIELLSKNTEKGVGAASKIKGLVGDRVKNYMEKISGDHHVQ